MKPTIPSLQLESLAKKTFGGLDPKAVAAKFAEFEAAWAAYDESFASLEGRIRELETQVAAHAGEKETIQNALIAAQKASDELKREAERVADILEEQARKQAEETLEAARAEVDRVEGEHRVALKDLQGDLERHMLLKHRFVDEFRTMLRGYLAEIDTKYPSGKAAIVEEVETEAAAETRGD